MTRRKLLLRPAAIVRIRAAVLLLVLVSRPLMGQNVIYVDAAAVGVNDGSSWENAYVTLQDALAVAESGTEIWVSEGTYWPDRGQGVLVGDRDTSFVLSAGIKIFGGFQGGETLQSERDSAGTRTVLSGDLQSNDSGLLSEMEPTRQDNSETVVRVLSGQGESAPLLDGVVVRGGHSVTFAAARGGGVYVDSNVDLVVKNSMFTDNYAYRCGGAISSRGGLEVIDSVFQNNAATMSTRNPCLGLASGSAIFNRSDRTLSIRGSRFANNNGYEGCGSVAVASGSADIVDSEFYNNRGAFGASICFVSADERYSNLVNVRSVNGVAAEYGGGALIIEGSTVNVVNALFHSNTAVAAANNSHGGAVFCYGNSSLNIDSSTLADNNARYGGAVSSGSSCRTRIRNSIVWSNWSIDSLSIAGLGSTPGDSIHVESSIVGGHVDSGVVLDSVTTLDPRFVDPTGPNDILGDEDDDYRLMAGSPGIDVGRDELLPLDTFDLDGDGDSTEALSLDFLGVPRVLAGSTRGAATDLGAYEYAGFDTQRSSVVSMNRSCRVEVYPNPARNSTTVAVRSPNSPLASLTVFDLTGRVWMRRPLHVTGQAATLAVSVRSWPVGLYYFRVFEEPRLSTCVAGVFVLK